MMRQWFLTYCERTDTPMITEVRGGHWEVSVGEDQGQRAIPTASTVAQKHSTVVPRSSSLEEKAVVATFVFVDFSSRLTLPGISLGSPTGNAGLDPELKHVLIDSPLAFVIKADGTGRHGRHGYCDIVKRCTFHHGQTLLLSESGIWQWNSTPLLAGVEQSTLDKLLRSHCHEIITALKLS